MTDLELEQQTELEYMDYCIDSIKEQYEELKKERDRLLVLAVKWCDRNHHDWEEIKGIYNGRYFDDLRKSGGIADAP